MQQEGLTRMRATANRSNGALHPAAPVVKVFAARLKEWRRDAGLPLKHVARDLGVSLSIVSEWENGNRFPSVVNLDALSRYIGVPVCCLLYFGAGHCPHGAPGFKGAKVLGRKANPARRKA